MYNQITFIICDNILFIVVQINMVRKKINAMGYLLFLIQFLIFNNIYHVICSDELKLITKLPKNPLTKYESYSDVTLVHYNIPMDTTEAVFLFKVKDKPTSIFVRSCDVRNITVYLKPGSFPVINPDGVAFPITFLNASRPELYNLTFKSDLKPYYINISAPVPGNWFAAAFISWTDSKNDKIEQQGLSSECDANLHSELFVIQKHIKILSSLTNNNITLQKKHEIYKFYIPENIDHVYVSFHMPTQCSFCQNLVVSVQESRIPDEQNYLEQTRLGGKYKVSDYSMQFWPYENKWHYIDFHYDTNNTINKIVQFSVSLKFISNINTKVEQNSTTLDEYFKTAINKKSTFKYKPLQTILPYKQYDLMRISSVDNFIFEYDIPPFKNGSSPLLLNVSNTEMSVLKFTIYEIIDIGGTLSLGFAIKPNTGKKTESSNASIIVCASKDVKEVPTFPKQCVYNNVSTLAPVVLNSSEIGSLKLFHIPFPDAGTWYVTLRTFYEDCPKCKCSNNCDKMYEICSLDCKYTCKENCESCIEKCSNKALLSEQCSSCDCDGVCIKKKNDASRNVSIVFSISSFPCIGERCGKFGKCNRYITGGFIFSSCHCYWGYRGWDCSDDSLARSAAEILLSVLLLTLRFLIDYTPICTSFISQTNKYLQNGHMAHK